MWGRKATALGSLKRATCLPASSRISLVGHRVPVGHLHEGHHLLAPPLARAAGHHHVGDGGVGDDGLLHLFGEDLLAPGVDGHRVAAEQLDLAVGEDAGPVAGHRVVLAVDHREGARRLLGVAEVAEGHRPALGQPTHLLVAGLEHARHVRAHHHGPGPGHEGPRRHRPRARRHPHLDARLRGAGHVGDHDGGEHGQEALFEADAQRRPPAAEGHERAWRRGRRARAPRPRVGPWRRPPPRCRSPARGPRCPTRRRGRRTGCWWGRPWSPPWSCSRSTPTGPRRA